MVVLFVALAFLAVTALLARFAPSTPWPVFTTTAAITLFWMWLVGASGAGAARPSDIGALTFAAITTAAVASLFAGAWIIVAALVPAGRKPLWQFIALVLTGLAFIGAGIAAPAALRDGQLDPLAHSAVAATGLMGTLFAGYLAYGKLYATVARSWLDAHLHAGAGPNAVVVLGARIVDGKLTRLLQRRVDLGIDTADRIWIAQSDPGRGNDQGAAGLAPLVFSGGSPSRGPAATDTAEAHVMAAAAEAQGVSRERVVVEDQSTTTAENFRLSAQLLEARGVAEPYVGVTNSFHAFRASMHMRRAGIDGHVIGGASGSLSAPFHTLREFAAFLYEMVRPV